MNKKYFGTDGIRGKVGEFPITPDFVLKLGWAVGKVLKRTERSTIVIGKDTRLSNYMFESALHAGLSAAGIKVLLLGPMPTPAVAYLARTFRADAGIVISASHNPHYDNGIKFFDPDGKKLPDEIELAIEAYLEKPLELVDSRHLGKARRVEDAAGRYIEFCKSTFGRGLNLRGMKIVLDCANGATFRVAPRVFNELGANIEVINADPDGVNINKNAGSTHPNGLRAAVLSHGADLGIAFDGDGDRVLMVDDQGQLIDGDQLLYVIAAHRIKQGVSCQGVVGTLMSNLGLEKAVEALGMRFLRAKVGDRYVMEALTENGWLVGGESSGHLMCLDLTTTGDGIVSVLQILKAMVESEASLADLVAPMKKFPQALVNVKIPKRVNLSDYPDIDAAVDEVESQLGDSGRVLLRPSGTEPLIRVMVEGAVVLEVNELANQLANEVKRILAS